jgi:hypothetical protein
MNPKTSNDLFNKIRSQFSNIEIGDESGQPTADASKAVFFDFEFKEDADTFGRVSVSLADGESMKVFYNRNLVDKIDEDSKSEWYDFLKELKDFAVEHQLRFDVRDITKSNLTKQDYKNLADTNETVNTDEMSEELARITKLAGVNEGLTGSARRSYENLDKTKLIIRHTGSVDETVPGARSRQIQSLYIENEDGERFKYPMTHLAGARAMTRHVANGGRPHDEFGQHIVSTSEDIAKLNSFARYVSNKDQLNDNAGDIIEQTKLKLENLRSYVKNLSKQSHYEESMKNFKPSEAVVLDDETANSYKDKFTLKNLDGRVEEALPLIHKIMSELQNTEEEKVNELDPGDEPIDAPIEPQVDHGAVVQSFLNDPDSKIYLNKEMPDHVLKYKGEKHGKNTAFLNILSDIASRMLTKSGEEDRIANFASRVADAVAQEKSPFFKPGPDHMKNKKIALQLAQRYMKDKVEIDPADYNPKKDIKGKPKTGTESFEQWVDETLEPFMPEQMSDKQIDNFHKELDKVVHKHIGHSSDEKKEKEDMKKEEVFPEGTTFEDIKPYVSMYRDERGKVVNDVLDSDGKSVFKTHDGKKAMAYLARNFDKLKRPMQKESINEAKIDSDTAQNIAGVEEEISRITQLANYQ